MLVQGVWNATGDRVTISLYTKYVTAYYWAITTISTVGFGDITGQTVNRPIAIPSTKRLCGSQGSDRLRYDSVER